MQTQTAETLHECVVVTFFLRYVMCMDLQPGSEAIHDYMYEVNLELCRLQQEMDVLEVSAVALEVGLRCLGINSLSLGSLTIYKKCYV